MASTPNTENLVSANEKYAASFSKGDLDLPPAKQYAIVTCMDARIDPAAAFGIDLGDAHVIRNAGGNAKDAVRSLVISEQLLATKEIILIKHTGCGMLTFKNEDAVTIVWENLPKGATDEIKTYINDDFQPFPDLEQAVKDDVAFLKKIELIPDTVAISGWVYDVKTGKAKFIV